MKALFIGLIIAAAAFAADVSGTWSGSFIALRPDGSQDEAKPAFLELKQDGEKLTGKIGQNPEHAFEISEGSLKGDVVTLSASMPEGSLKVTMKLVDGKLEGELLMENNGDKRKATLKFAK